MGVFRKYKDKNGNASGPWFIQYPYSRDAKTGKIKYRTQKASYNKKNAEKIFRDKVDRFQNLETFGTRFDLEMSFSDLMDWGLSQEVMKVKASATEDEGRAKHLKNHFSEWNAHKITPLDVDNFRIKMKRSVSSITRKTYSGTTVNKTITLARRIYYLAMDAGMAKTNPFSRRGIYAEEPKGKYIPDHEFWEILAYLPEYVKPVFLTAYLTGMRRSEILELEWSRVNFNQGYIDLTAENTKTNEPRRIYFNSLEKLKNVFNSAFKEKGAKQKLVFTNSNGEPVPKWYIQRLMKKACLQAGVGPYRLHDLRHTYNTNMVKAGVDRVIIMKLTGHKTFSMFSRYTHLDQEQGEDAMSKLDELLLGKERQRNRQKENTDFEIGLEIDSLAELSTPYVLPEAEKVTD
jgi:integrase